MQPRVGGQHGVEPFFFHYRLANERIGLENGTHFAANLMLLGTCYCGVGRDILNMENIKEESAYLNFGYADSFYIQTRSVMTVWE